MTKYPITGSFTEILISGILLEGNERWVFPHFKKSLCSQCGLLCLIRSLIGFGFSGSRSRKSQKARFPQVAVP